MITIIVEEVTVEDLEDDLMEAEMMTRRTRMRLEVVARTRGEITQRGRGRGQGAGRGGFCGNCFHCNEEGHRPFECPQCQGRNDRRIEW